MDKFKIIREYERFYLAKSSMGFNVCFNKNDVETIIDGFIVEKKKIETRGGKIPSDKINRAFYFGKSNKKRGVLLWKHY